MADLGYVDPRIWGYRLDFGDIGDTLAGGVNSYMDKKRYQDAFKDGDYTKAFDRLLRAGDLDGAGKLAKIYELGQGDDSFGASGGRIYNKNTGEVVSEAPPKPPKSVSALERIRTMIEEGKPLTPSQQRLYDDSLRLDPVDKILRDNDEVPVQKVQTTTVPAPEVSTGPLPMPKSKAELKGGQVYDLPNGSQGLWNGTEFEILN